MKWADKYRTLRFAPMPTPPPTPSAARDFGAEGIGLCRTEHMFFDAERIHNMREMILATDKEGRIKALAKLLPYQREDFVGIFKAMKGLPVTIRLLDPPLHEFLPHDEKNQEEMAQQPGPVARAGAAAVSPSCTKPIRCSGIAAVAWRSPIRRFWRCRSARSSRPPRVQEAQDLRLPEIMIPLAGTKAELDTSRSSRIERPRP